MSGHRVVPVAHDRRTTDACRWRCVWCDDCWRWPPDRYDSCPEGRKT